MEIGFGQITRGGGKIFMRLLAPAETVSVEAAAAAPDGSELPALVLYDKTGWILVLAVIHADQHVSVAAHAADGSVVARGQTDVAEKNAALASKANTLLKKADAAAMRNIDARDRSDEASFRFTSYFHRDILIDGQKLSTLTGEVIVPVTSANASDPVRIDILGQDGRPVEGLEFAITNDFLGDSEDGIGIARFIAFYANFPIEQDSLVLWVRFDGATPDGLRVLEPHVMQDMRGMWKGIIWRSPQGYSYNDWFYSRQRPTRRELELQRRASFDIEPVFSIIVPLFKTPISFFYDMVGSVVAQTYGKWELLLVNASPEDAELGEAVRQVCAADKRIKSILLDGNYGITLNTRAGMEAATGDFLSFFDHDDVLEPDCLYEYVKGINAYPDTDLLYCDEDKLLDGKYLDAFMKPDLDREMLTCCNYICHMLTVRKSVVDALPELPGKDSDGAQDYDLTLSVVERARNVYHARKALYHWRIHSGSTASHPDAKPWAEDAGRRVLQRYYDRIGLKAKAVVNREMDNLYHVDYETPADALVSIVIPNKDAADVLARCIDSIFARTTHRAFEIVIVENNSTDPATFDYYDKLTAEHPEVRVVTYEGEFNYSAINNLGVRYTKGDYLLFLNNDVEVIEPRWLELLMGPFMRGGVGIVGAKLFYPSKLIQHAGVIIPQAGPTHVSRLIPSSEGGYLNIPFAMSSQYLAVTGACAMTKREYFDAVSGFDETLPVAYNDVDFCLRIRELGLACVLEVRAQLYHYESVTRGHDGRSKEKLTRLTADQGRMMERWPEYYACGDPYYNWNCEPGTELYQLRW